METSDDASITRFYDANGLFVRGVVVVGSGSSYVFGNLSAEAYTGVDGLADKRDVSDLGEKFDSLFGSNEILSLLRYFENLIPAAYAQSSAEDDLINLTWRDFLPKNKKEWIVVGAIILTAAIQLGITLRDVGKVLGLLAASPEAIIFVVILFLLAYCHKSNASVPQEIKFRGGYGGDDSGSFEVKIGVDRTVNGSAHSSIYGKTYGVSGRVDGNQITVSTSGSVTSGAVFRGSFEGLSVSGTWSNFDTGEVGTFKGMAASTFSS
jgi:hypothetical protein